MLCFLMWDTIDFCYLQRQSGSVQVHEQEYSHRLSTTTLHCSGKLVRTLLFSFKFTYLFVEKLSVNNIMLLLVIALLCSIMQFICHCSLANTGCHVRPNISILNSREIAQCIIIPLITTWLVFMYLIEWYTLMVE